MHATPHAAIAQIAARQHGTFTTEQARAAGLPERTLRDHCDRGTYARLATNTYCIAGAPATWRRTAKAATLANGTDALLAHRASVQLFGLTPRRVPLVEVVVAHHRWRTAGQWTVHESRQLGAADRWSIDGIPVTSIERSIIDVARYWNARYVGSLLDDAVSQGLTTYHRFSERFAELRRRGRPGVTTIRAVLLDRDLAEGTPFEQQMARLLRHHGLPAPVRQHRVVVEDRCYFIDFAYPTAQLGIECDSSTWHTKPYQFDDDLRRQNDIQGTGLLLLRYTRSRLRDDPDGVAEEIRRNLRSRTPNAA